MDTRDVDRGMMNGAVCGIWVVLVNYDTTHRSDC